MPSKTNEHNCNNEIETVFDVEKIYICMGYFEDFEHFYEKTINFLRDKKARKINDCWIINDSVNRKTYEIKILTDIVNVENALMTDNSHIIIRGHANFGLGPVFLKEKSQKRTNDILGAVKYIDDDSLLNIGSKWIDLPVSKLRINNKLINWWPEYKDGSSGIAAYDFKSTVKKPPYNYYLTYQVPGDSNFHKILDEKGQPIERFPLSGKEPWFSRKGIEPDVSNPSHHKYFIINKKNKVDFFRKYGKWKESRQPKGFYGEHFLRKKQGGGEENRAEWHFKIPFKGKYDILSWWPSNKNNASSIKYSLRKKNNANKRSAYQNLEERNKPLALPERIETSCFGQRTTVADEPLKQHEMICNQKTEGNQWKKLGSFQLEAGNYIVTQTDLGNDGITVADALRIVHEKNPMDTFMPFFFSNKKKAKINEIVTFFSNSNGAIYRYKWDFGDGNKIITHKKYVFHQYRKPGIYDVSLEICDFQGKMLKKTKNEYIAVDIDEIPIQPEFSGYPNNSVLPFKVCFTDRSRGKVKEWHWDFGDGRTSTEQNPEHTYLKRGNYTVCLTIIGEDGKTQSVTKEKFIRAFIYDKIIDNID